MDISGTLFSAGVGVLSSGTVYLISKIVNLDKTLAAHVAADAVVFDGLKGGVTRIESKVDKIVDHLLSKTE